MTRKNLKAPKRRAPARPNGSNQRTLQPIGVRLACRSAKCAKGPALPTPPPAILFDLDDTLIPASAQPEDAWRRRLSVFAAHLDAHDAETIERVRIAVMEEARAFWSDQQAAAKWRLDIAGARRLSVRRGLARARATTYPRMGELVTALER